MYLSELKLWNFRKYGIAASADIETTAPTLSINFHDGVKELIICMRYMSMGMKNK